MTVRPIVIAHRGGAGEAPENTMEAFERAIRLGYPGVECDVRMSKDGVPLVVHDERVADPGGNLRPIHTVPASDLAWLPRLDAVLALPWGGMTLMVEVKPTMTDEALGAAAARAIVEHGLSSQAILASFSADVLISAGQTAPSLRLMALLDAENFSGSWREVEGPSFFGWGVDFEILGWDASFLASLRERGRVWTWTIKHLGQMRRAVALGVDGLITDIPGQVLAALVS